MYQDRHHDHVNASVGKRALISTLFFVIFINLFIFHTLGSVAFVLILSGLWAFVTYAYPTHPQKSILISGIHVSILIALLSILADANGFVEFIATGWVFVGLASLLYITRSTGTFFHSLSEVVLLPILLVVPYFRGAFNGWEYIASHKKNERAGSWIRSIVIGLIVGIPVSLILLGLFSGADPIFAHATQGFLTDATMQRIVTHIYITCIVFLIILPVSFLFVVRRLQSPVSWLTKSPFHGEMTVVNSLVALVVGAFLVVQWPYIFVRVAQEVNLSRFGVATYSEYVKRGFGEFIFIALILYGILWMGLMAIRAAGRRPAIVWYTQAFLFAEFAIYLVSIFRRVWLYQYFHGLSLGRVYGALFLAGVTTFVITLAARHVWPKIRWVYVECGCAMVLFCVLSFSNVEHLIATSRPPTVNNRIDYVYLSRLSADGYAGWKQAYSYTLSVLSDHPYDQKKLIDKGQRQTIGYAQAVLVQFTRNYDDLIRYYGSDAEKEHYARSILKSKKNYLTLALPDVSRRSQEERKEKVQNGEYMLQEKKMVAEMRWIDSMLSKQNIRLDEFFGRLDAYYPMFGYDRSIDGMSFYHFTIGKNMPHVSGRIDAIYSWNWSKRNAYAYMKADMPLERIIAMQTILMDLNKRIASQPTSEQNYDTDVSFDGPFLGSL